MIAVFGAILLIVIFNPNGSFAKGLLSGRDSLMNDEIPWSIMAKSLTYNEKEGTYLAEGDVVISKAQQTLYTQHAVFNVKTGIAKVSGGLRLETEGDIITGKEGSFNLNTHKVNFINLFSFIVYNSNCISFFGKK